MTDALAELVRAGDRRALAQAITLVESSRPDHRDEARQLLDELLNHTGGSLRVAVSGAPGAGKSTLIEALGILAIGAGHRVAVLAVDPSSTRTGGSILGDKTRMADLGRHPEAYIRPSPTSGTLGGVARHTREGILLCEAAGFDVVLVETVGVGQSEVAAADIVDILLLVTAPGGGDELQGVKRGIMEFADILVVNKADGDLVAAANQAIGDLRHALHLLQGPHAEWEREVILVSALEGRGIDATWHAVEALHHHLRDTGALDDLRRNQAVSWMWTEVRQELFDQARRRIGDVDDITDAVRIGALAPASGARELLQRLADARGDD